VILRRSGLNGTSVRLLGTRDRDNSTSRGESLGRDVDHGRITVDELLVHRGGEVVGRCVDIWVSHS
jgi:hypothetical protein